MRIKQDKVAYSSDFSTISRNMESVKTKASCCEWINSMITAISSECPIETVAVAQKCRW